MGILGIFCVVVLGCLYVDWGRKLLSVEAGESKPTARDHARAREYACDINNSEWEDDRLNMVRGADHDGAVENVTGLGCVDNNRLPSIMLDGNFTDKDIFNIIPNEDDTGINVTICKKVLKSDISTLPKAKSEFVYKGVTFISVENKMQVIFHEETHYRANYNIEYRVTKAPQNVDNSNINNK